jgi:dTDP-4-amino-4,6-dideoxygalactose transaminase
MKVPFLNLSAGILECRSALDAAQARVLDRGWVLMGPELEAFEREWSQWLGARHAIGVANGLDALRLALEACGVGPGDEVIVPSNTYIATWLAVSELGAKPIPVEPDEDTCVIDPARIEAAINGRTKAIMPVHLYGQSADLDPIRDIATRRHLAVIEDAAQAHGATYRGRKIGAHGDAVCWSFYPTKNLGALADAGAITTDDDALADRLRVARNYGQRRRYVCEVRGWNSRLDELNAGYLRAKLPKLAEWNTRRAALAERYLDRLAGCGLQLPTTAPGNGNVWHLFVVRHPERDRLQQALEEVGVGTICHYPIPPHLQTAYADLGYHPGAFPIAERIHDTCFSLPLHPHLSDESQNQVIDALRHVTGR